MLTWEVIADMDMSGDELLTEMQESIQWALEEDADPGPAVALALVREATARQELENSLSSVAEYVLLLEKRLIKSGLRFEEAETRILGDSMGIE